ncbi:TetR family transcriptional regulator [Streptomyces sp. NBC_00316]|uniref:TetR family transcriptional regulator n=1 Tax=Streptomyces sp. NBC_00316 TaxID=2975710 RepID=UPI002E29D3A9|nr:TetR family transcriptional regulator [Streptomyces sp. NBC_00316]
MTTTRKYNSPRRANSAAATREAILSSAHALFLARGYAGVTIGEIAEAGKVAVPPCTAAWATSRAS